MQEMDVPIFKATYELYKTLYAYRATVPKLDRYGLWQRTEGLTLSILEAIIRASQVAKSDKLTPLEQGSLNLNVLRVLLRLAKDTRAIDLRKYAVAQAQIDEIGRMLGGWIKSVRER